MSDDSAGQEVGETDRFDESTNLQYGVVEATIDEEDVHRPGECHIVFTKHDERHWLTFHAESDIETNILFDQFEWRPDEYTGTLYLKQSTGKHPVTVAMFDWHVAFPRDGFGLVGEWFVEHLDLDEYRAGVPCPKDGCDAEALHTGLASVCESPDCDFYAEGHIEAPHDDQQELATDGGQPVEDSVSQIQHLVCTACEGNVTAAYESDTETPVLVCHCTHDDGLLNRQPMDRVESGDFPEVWELRSNGKEVATDGGQPACEECGGSIETRPWSPWEPSDLAVCTTCWFEELSGDERAEYAAEAKERQQERICTDGGTKIKTGRQHQAAWDTAHPIPEFEVPVGWFENGSMENHNRSQVSVRSADWRFHIDIHGVPATATIDGPYWAELKRQVGGHESFVTDPVHRLTGIEPGGMQDAVYLLVGKAVETEVDDGN